MGDGSDTFVWNAGDGSDTVEGQGGSDRMVLSGSDASENVSISSNGSRVRVTRDIGCAAMDLNGVEDVDFNALGGADTITITDTSATDLAAVNLNLKSSAGTGDGQSDSVIVNGTDGPDSIQILSRGSGSLITVAGLVPVVNITGAEATNDHLTVNALGGDDVLDASNFPADLIGLTLNGGTGNNVIRGNPGDGGSGSPPDCGAVADSGSNSSGGNASTPASPQVDVLQEKGSQSQSHASEGRRHRPVHVQHHAARQHPIVKTERTGSRRRAVSRHDHPGGHHQQPLERRLHGLRSRSTFRIV
jgi:hypothetical protein